MGKKGTGVEDEVRKMMMVGMEVNALHKLVVMVVEVVLYKAVEMVPVVNDRRKEVTVVNDQGKEVMETLALEYVMGETLPEVLGTEMEIEEELAGNLVAGDGGNGVCEGGETTGGVGEGDRGGDGGVFCGGEGEGEGE